MKLSQFFGAHGFGDRGKAPDIAEHQGQFPHLAPQFEILRMLRQPLDNGRGQIAAEGRSHATAFPFAGQVLQTTDE